MFWRTVREYFSLDSISLDLIDLKKKIEFQTFKSNNLQNLRISILFKTKTYTEEIFENLEIYFPSSTNDNRRHVCLWSISNEEFLIFFEH